MAEQSAVIRELLQRSQIAASIGSGSWAAASRAFRGESFDAWADALASLISQRLSSGAVVGFVDKSPACADAVGAEAALHLAPAVLTVWRAAGPRAVEVFLDVAPAAASRLREAQAFKDWLDLVLEMAELAPETLELMLNKSEALLTRISVSALRGWALNGIRSTAGNLLKRIAYSHLPIRMRCALSSKQQPI